MIKLRSLFCALFMPIAATAEQPIDMCVAPHANLDVQILACEVAAQMDTTSPAVLAYLPPIIAELRGEQGDFDTALAQIGAENAESVDLLLAMGAAQVEAKRFELAMIFFHVALYYFPENIRVLEAVNHFVDDTRLEFQDDDIGFISILSAGLTKSPSNPVLRNERARLYVAQGDIESALIDWDVAINSAIYPYLFRFRRAEGLWTFERGDEALEELKPLTFDLLPGGSYETELSNNNMSSSNIYLEELQLEIFQQIELIRARVYLLQIQIYVAQPDLETALRIADAWVDVDIRHGQPLLERAKILSTMGRDADALEDLDHAVLLALQYEDGEIGRFSRVAILDRANFYIKRDEAELAMRDIDRVLAIESPELIHSVQNKLAEYGLFDGEIDGVYTPETRRALLTCIRRGMCDP